MKKENYKLGKEEQGGKEYVWENAGWGGELGSLGYKRRRFGSLPSGQFSDNSWKFRIISRVKAIAIYAGGKSVLSFRAILGKIWIGLLEATCWKSAVQTRMLEALELEA